MSKIIKKVIGIIGVSIFLFVGCSNINGDSERNSDKENINEQNEENFDEKDTLTNNETRIEDEMKENSEDKTIGLNKKEYLDKMDNLDDNLNVKLKDKLEGTTLEMREATSEIYTAWDEVLNEIYSEIISTLSNEEKDKLILEETNWIKERDEKADNAAKEVEGGTLEPLMRTSSLANSTKERCYELVNNYIK